MVTYNQNAMLAGVLIIGVLAWAIHTRDRSGGPKYEITGKYEELSHVNHAQLPHTTDGTTKIRTPTRRAPYLTTELN